MLCKSCKTNFRKPKKYSMHQICNAMHVMKHKKMGPKRNDWKDFTYSCGLNPSQLRKYMDACEQYLISSTDEGVLKPFTCISTPLVKMKITNMEGSIGLMDSKLHCIGEAPCYTCGKHISCREENIICANPFTVAQFMILCKECNIS